MELTSSEADFAAKAATGPDASAAGEIDALIRSEFKIKSSHGDSAVFIEWRLNQIFNEINIRMQINGTKVFFLV
ncbi:hypothetical protein L2E82_50876 [Cichorium intybus]|nr:hypothetical protein L2E82_50876 [Cichorium intybus]